MTAQRKSYRIAAWGTGYIGMHALRKVIEHPHFEPVGVRVYSDAIRHPRARGGPAFLPFSREAGFPLSR